VQKYFYNLKSNDSYEFISSGRVFLCHAIPKRLKDHGIMPLSFFGKESMEPTVIGWMPAAAIYFRDPDGHLIEYLTMLDDRERRPDLIVTWSEWINSNT